MLDEPAVERTAITLELLARRLADQADRLSNQERDAICRALARHSPAIRVGFRWTEVFPVLFTVGVLTLLLAALTITNPTVAGVLLVIGTVCLGIGGVKLWRFSWGVLDLAVGAYLSGGSSARVAGETRHPC